MKANTSTNNNGLKNETGRQFLQRQASTFASLSICFLNHSLFHDPHCPSANTMQIIPRSTYSWND